MPINPIGEVWQGEKTSAGLRKEGGRKTTGLYREYGSAGRMKGGLHSKVCISVFQNLEAPWETLE